MFVTPWSDLKKAILQDKCFALGSRFLIPALGIRFQVVFSRSFRSWSQTSTNLGNRDQKTGENNLALLFLKRLSYTFCVESEFKVKTSGQIIIFQKVKVNLLFFIVFFWGGLAFRIFVFSPRLLTFSTFFLNVNVNVTIIWPEQIRIPTSQRPKVRNTTSGFTFLQLLRGWTQRKSRREGFWRLLGRVCLEILPL